MPVLSLSRQRPPMKAMSCCLLPSSPGKTEKDPCKHQHHRLKQAGLERPQIHHHVENLPLQVQALRIGTILFRICSERFPPDQPTCHGHQDIKCNTSAQSSSPGREISRGELLTLMQISIDLPSSIRRLSSSMT